MEKKLSVIDKIKSSLFFEILGIMKRNKNTLFLCFVLMWCFYLIVYVANTVFTVFSDNFLILLIILIMLSGGFIFYLFVKKKTLSYSAQILKKELKGKFMVFSLIHIVLYVIFSLVLLIIGFVVMYSVKTDYLMIIINVIGVILFFKFFVILNVLSIRYLQLSSVRNSVRVSLYDLFRNKLSLLKLFCYEIILFGIFFIFYLILSWIVSIFVASFGISDFGLLQKTFMASMVVIFFLYVPVMILFAYFYLFKILVKK